MTLLEQIRANIRTALDERTAAQSSIDAVVSAAESEARSELTDVETQSLAEARSKRTEIDERIAGMRAHEAQLVADNEARAAAENLAREIGPAPAGPNVRVGSEPRTYNPGNDKRGALFLRDIVARSEGDFDAAQRLGRHMAEERAERGAYLAGAESRAIGTAAVAGLTVPQYLVDLVAPLARAMRPVADICNIHELPAEGMTVNISRITTGTSAAPQASENAAVSETNLDDTLLTVDVRTISGQQTVSRQAIDRSSGGDTIVLQDLVRAYQTNLDSGILNSAGTSGTHLGIRSTSGIISVAYTDASPTAAELYPKLADLIQQIQAGVFAGLSHFVMHPRRWWWIAKELGSTFPLLQIQGAGNRAGNAGDTQYGGLGRDIFGVPVVLDGNIPTNLGAGTNEDVILGVTADELHLWEDPAAPLYIKADQTAAASLGVLFVVYGYSAFAAGRYPGAHGTIGGTGLITPTF